MRVGIDLGGTNTKIGLVDDNGKLIERFSFSTRDFSKPNNWVKRCLLELKGIKGIKTIGIGVPGAADFKNGQVLYLPNLPGWEGVKIVERLKSGLKKDIKVAVDNDATCMAIAEHRFGAAKGYENAVCITLGTGVGGGLILNGRIYRGSRGVAGEIGHFPLVPWGKNCSCGGRGCVERYVGNRTLLSWARRNGIIKRGESLEDITARAKQGDSSAIEFWDKVAYTMAPVLVGVVNLLNPDVVVVGGGVSGAGRFVLSPLKKYIKAYAMKVQARSVRIVQAKLRNDAGLIGAAMLLDL